MTSGIGNNWPYNEPYNYPSYGPSSTTPSYITPTPHLNFFQHWFGTSPLDIVINSLIVIAGLYLIVRFIIIPIMNLCLDALDFRRLQGQETVFLELTPPAISDKSPHATSQFFAMLHSLSSLRTQKDRLLRRKSILSLEIVSSREQGIRYVACLSASAVSGFKNAAKAYLPDVRFAEVTDYLTPTIDDGSLIELQQARHFALSLSPQQALNQHDPMAYFTSTMTQLDPGDLTVYQVILTPASTREINKVHNKLLAGARLDLDKGFWHFIGKLIRLALTIVRATLRAVMAAVLKLNLPRQHSRSQTVHEQRIDESMVAKLSQPLLHADIRVFVRAKDKQDEATRLNGFQAALHALQVEGLQALIVRPGLPIDLYKRYKRFKFARRLPAMLPRNSSLLSVSEIASLYHFPYGDSMKIENIAKSLSPTLPTSAAMKRHADNGDFDTVLGRNDHHGTTTNIGLTLEQRQKHTYVIGKTGTGKTTLLKSAIYQDMVNGNGVAVLDPHGDMFQELFGMIPESRQKDVVVFDPSDSDFPIGLNILDPGIEFANDDDKQEWITATVLSVFSKLTEEAMWGPRMEHIMRSATMTALKLPDPSLYTVQRLLTDSAYRKEVANNLDDPVLRQFWLKEFALMGTMQQASAIGPLTHRLGHFITTKMSRHILLQQKSTLRLGEIMDEGKILLVNLSKGDIGEDQSFFFGTILTSFIWMAAYQRIKVPESKRRDFFVYVDEFQNFATPRFAEMFSEARKFHVSLTISHQNVAQVEDKHILKVVAGNAGTLISFRISPEDETFILPHMKPVVDKGDMVNLPPYHFYMKVTGQDSEDAFSGQTVPLEVDGAGSVKEVVIANSQKRYGTPKKTVEAYMEKLFGQPKSGINPSKKRSGSNTNDKGPAKVHGA